ncbi:ACAP2 [Symbiodinium natans]|uniref:ACAP2 protein n=1 Tax=Symbiodinium natans TaxID=878477 RepID=A0A812JES8_9DINO|nr:ACAP2 [Symbiodinium natans]
MAGSSRAAVFLASLPPVNTGDRSFWDVADDSTHSIQPFANVLEVASDLARFLNFAWPYGIKARSTSQNIYADLECTGAQQCTLVAFRSSLALKTVRALNAQSPGKCCAENDEISRLQKEEPGANNQAFLAKLNKADSNFPSVKKALKTGAKIDWRNPEWDGATLLLRAARTGSLELAMFCLSQAANISERDNSGRGVLHWTALSGNNSLMQYLLTEYREQLNVAQEDGGGDSPLHLGAYAGHLGVVRLLLRADAKETTNAGGFTPTQLAEAKRMWHVVRHLRENHNDDMVKERLGHILRHNKTEEAEEESVSLRELVFRPCDIDKADQLIALKDD